MTKNIIWLMSFALFSCHNVKSTPNSEDTFTTTSGKQVKIECYRHASQLADWLMNTSQRQEDGAYANHQNVYTSVIYIAKSMLELSIAEQEVAEEKTFWLNAAKRHYNSAKRAIDQLVAQQGNFETEGEGTFEDGMQR